MANKKDFSSENSIAGSEKSLPWIRGNAGTNSSFRVLFPKYSLTKLMVSHSLSRSAVTNQIAFDQRDSHSAPEFVRAMDCCCQAAVSKLETLGTIIFT